MNGRNVMTWCLLAAIVALGAFVRLYRISEQSVWWDDYNSIAYLGAPTLSDYLSIVEDMNEMHVPLYFVAQYYWGHAFGTSPVSIRLLTILVGLLAIPLLYVLGRDTFGRNAGLAAALLLAISPMHLFHDQSMRPYAFMVFFSLASMIAFLRAVNGGGLKWWIANFLFNVLLIETHYFGAVLLFTEGCYLLLTMWRRPLLVAAWSLPHVLLLAMISFWIHGASGVISGWYNDMCHAPTLGQYVADLFGDDSVAFNLELLPSGETWPFVPRTWVGVLHGAHWLFDLALLGMFAAGVARSIHMIIALLPFASPRKPFESAAAEQRNTLFLVVIVFVPVTTLAILSHVWRPAIFPRYTIYATPALYIIAGGALFTIKSSSWRRVALAGACAVYVYQLSWMLPAETRTQWREAAGYIKLNSAARDVILIASDSGKAYSALDLYLFNAHEEDLPVFPADSFQEAVASSRAFLSVKDAAAANRTVWLLIHRKYTDAALSDLDAALAGEGLVSGITTFPAMRKLTLYRIRRGNVAAQSDGTGEAVSPMDFDEQALAVTELCRSLTNSIMRQAYRRDPGTRFLLNSMASLDDDLTARILLTAQAAPEMNRPLMRDLASILFQRDLSGMNLEALHNRIESTSDPYLVYKGYNAFMHVALYYASSMSSLGDQHTADKIATLLAAIDGTFSCSFGIKTGDEIRPVAELVPDLQKLTDVGACLSRGENDRAAEICRSLVSGPSSIPVAGYVLGYLEYLKGNDSAALAALDEYDRICPDSGPSDLTRGLIWLKKGNRDEAMKQISVALEKDAGLDTLLGPLVEDVLVKQDRQAARTEIKRIESLKESAPRELVEMVERGMTVE